VELDGSITMNYIVTVSSIVSSRLTTCVNFAGKGRVVKNAGKAREE
jgi:hypothetical protein